MSEKTNPTKRTEASANMSKATFGTAVKAPGDIRTVELENVINAIRNGHWETETEQIRKSGNPELAKAIKAGLPYFIYGIFDGKRSNDRLVQMNGAILDYDHIPDIEGFKTLVSAELPYVRYAFQSPRDGVKLVIPFDRPVTDEKEYRAVFEHLKTETDKRLNHERHEKHERHISDGLSSSRLTSGKQELATPFPENSVSFICDNTPDPARACFVSWDPALLENENCEPFKVDSVRQNGSAKDKGRTEQRVSQPQSLAEIDTDLRVHSAVEFLCEQEIAYADWIRIGMALYSHYGEAGKPLWDIFAENPHYKDTPEILDSHWRSFNRKDKVSIGSLFYIAEDKGWVDTRPSTTTLNAKPVKSAAAAKYLRQTDLVESFGRPGNVDLKVSDLPPILQDYLAITDNITDAQAGAKLTAWLPCVAGNIGNRVYMVNNSARVFAHIWGIIIGPSSISRKTTVIKLARQTLEPYEEIINEEEPEEYLKRTLIMTDVTMTKLLSLLSENPNRIFIQMEVSAWMRQMNRHWNAGMKQALTDLFDGVDKTIANMDRTERIRKPAFSIIAASTEGWFYQEMKDVADQQSGFLQRFIFCLVQNVKPEEIDLTYREGEENSPELRRYEEMFSVFRNIPGNQKLTLSGEAAKLRNQLYKAKFEHVLQLKNDLLMSYFTRIYDGYFFKFCILFHLMQHWQELRDAMAEKAPVGTGVPPVLRHARTHVATISRNDEVGTGVPPVLRHARTHVATISRNDEVGTGVPPVLRLSLIHI